MVDQLVLEDGYYVPDAEQLITEDDTPVDNLASEKHQRLLVGSLYSALKDQKFIAAANVGVYHTDGEPAIVPDVFVSFDVEVPQDWWKKQNRCYLVWKFGKPPEIAIEIVSNSVGEELGEKLEIYQHMRVSYYIVFDPTHQLSEDTLRIYELRGRRLVLMQETWLDQVGLGLTLWEGEFEGRQDTWLRWCDQAGTVLATGDERASQAENRASQAETALEQERLAREQAEAKAQQLAERLRSMGIDPDTL